MKKSSYFQKIVWREIEKIPYGETRSYKDIAIQIGKPKSFRAVANACGKNPYQLLDHVIELSVLMEKLEVTVPREALC